MIFAYPSMHFLMRRLKQFCKDLFSAFYQKLGKADSSNLMKKCLVCFKSVHISPLEFLSFLRALPLNKLENTVINVIFLEDNASKMQNHFFNMLFLKSYQKEGVKNGKIDYSKLEHDFLTSLPKNKRIKDYIKSARRYSYAAYLAISSKTFSTEAGK